MNAAVNYKVGNEKLVKVLDGASSHLRGLLDRQGRPDGALRIAVVHRRQTRENHCRGELHALVNVGCFPDYSNTKLRIVTRRSSLRTSK